MTDRDGRKPMPARARTSEAGAKPTPARELNGHQGAPTPGVETPEVRVEADGVTWTARELGRSGGASGVAAPLLLLGFRDDSNDREAEREALVVAKSLTELSPEALREALSVARRREEGNRPKPFFADPGTRGPGERRRG